MKLIKVILNTFASGELSNEDYHSHDGISGTGLSEIYKTSILSWIKTARKPSDALGFGIASHANFLEPELFNAEFYRGFDDSKYPEALKTQNDLKSYLGEHGLKLSGSKKEQIERVLEFCKVSGESVEIIDELRGQHDQDNIGKIQVDPANFDQLECMRSRLLSDPAITDLVLGAMVEKSIICIVDFYDELNREEANEKQYQCVVKIRPDIVSRQFALVDYKTCLDCYDKFKKDLFNFNYDLKMALQHDILKLVYGHSPRVTLLAQNKIAPSQLSNPFEYKPWLLGPEIIDNGRAKYLIAIRRYCEYQQTKIPVGQGNHPEYVQFPAWAYASS